MFPKLSNINEKIANKIKSYANPSVASELTPWVRVFSGAKRNNLNGLILQSNTTSELLRATGESTTAIYGDAQSSGIMGVTWDGKIVESNSERALRPSPIINSVEIKEGQDQISREATVSITAYTLGQMELIQTYFLEPGYSLFIEFGFNKQGARGLTNTSNKGTDEIVEEITDKSLNYIDLNKTRLKTSGEYDAFLGFIVGGNVESSGDTFNITVNLRGEPSLPTYLQTYKNTKRLNENRDEIFSTSKVARLYELENFEGDDESLIAKRRFAYMFNELPSNKQLETVTNLIDEVEINQFINFDKGVEKNISNSIDSWVTEDVEIDGVDIKRETLFSKNKYIRMDLAVKILNKVGQANRFIIGKKSIAFTINIDNTIIGGFENMFSTNPNKLIIPGKIPDFYAYFLQAGSVEQKTNGNLKADGREFTPDEFDDLLPFLGEEKIDTDISEEPYFYGYLKYLFVNFDLFKAKLEKSIVNTREVFIDLLNELSSAANAFWKFQVVEGEFQQTNILSVDDLLERGQEEEAFKLLDSNAIERKIGDIEITVVDENFVGKIPTKKKDKIVEFQHNGIGSVFKSANLNIDLPSSMVGQIVSSRLGAVVNHEGVTLRVGENTFFESDSDLFVKELGYENSSNKTEVDKSSTTKKPKIIEKTVRTPLGNIKEYYDENGNERTQSDYQAQLNEDKKTKQNTLQSNVDKITVLPKVTLDSDSVKNFFKDKQLVSEDWFRERFAIHTFNDSDFFDTIKVEKMYNKYEDDKKQEGLSTLIPIKYSFSIIGNSGIKRGDMFKIKGIPKKYSEKGLFQVTEITQSVTTSGWVTEIVGQFRQFQ